MASGCTSRPAGSTTDTAPTEIAVIGDSFATGFGLTDPRSRSFPRVLASDICRRIVVNAQDGTGYVNPPHGHRGFQTYRARLPEVPKGPLRALILQGSDNDGTYPPAEITDRAEQTFDALTDSAPGRLIVAVGPTRVPDKELAQLTMIRDALRTAAAHSHVVFVDPIAENWLASPDSYGTDREHPSAAGHTELAMHLRAVLAAHGIDSRCGTGSGSTRASR
ncbi:SGNH/GDSL hydrolase family protein [Gordonia sp. DT30]|uniref:SGNH/GDSL hydrolase family protein n=1 Tax=Gordonia sp. DT30 TaxID=3416546 RepID=UPI003CEB74BF